MKKWEFDVSKFLEFANIHSKKEYESCTHLINIIYKYIEVTCPYKYDLLDGNSILHVCNAIEKAL